MIKINLNKKDWSINCAYDNVFKINAKDCEQLRTLKLSRTFMASCSQIRL